MYVDGAGVTQWKSTSPINNDKLHSTQQVAQNTHTHITYQICDNITTQR